MHIPYAYSRYFHPVRKSSDAIMRFGVMTVFTCLSVLFDQFPSDNASIIRLSLSAKLISPQLTHEMGFEKKWRFFWDFFSKLTYESLECIFYLDFHYFSSPSDGIYSRNSELENIVHSFVGFIIFTQPLCATVPMLSVFGFYFLRHSKWYRLNRL